MLAIVFYSFSLSLLYVQYIGWYCGAGDFGLTGCISLSLSLAQPTFFDNNYNKLDSPLQRSLLALEDFTFTIIKIHDNENSILIVSMKDFYLETFIYAIRS